MYKQVSGQRCLASLGDLILSVLILPEGSLTTDGYCAFKFDKTLMLRLLHCCARHGSQRSARRRVKATKRGQRGLQESAIETAVVPVYTSCFR